MTIQREPNVPDEIWDAVYPLLEKWRIVAPHWCYRLRVFYAPEKSGEEYASIVNYYNQRTLTLSISGSFLGETRDAREKVIVHELMHGYTSLISDAARQCIEKILGPEFPTPGSRVAEEMITDAMEQATEDLALMLLRHNQPWPSP